MDWMACSRYSGDVCNHWRFLTRRLCNRSNTYTTLNALAGHFNSFGTGQPLPKKRFERAVKVGYCGRFYCTSIVLWVAHAIDNLLDMHSDRQLFEQHHDTFLGTANAGGR